MPRKHKFSTSGISRGGKQRTKAFVWMITEEQHEYLMRVCYKADSNMADFVRLKTFRPGWRLILDDLREEQAGLPPEELNSRYRSGNHTPRKPTGGNPNAESS